ncbi:MAG TPA: cell division protein CrgA [Streptosporangiaceae bacterium]
MAKSKVRKKAVYTPPQRSQKIQVSPRWLVPAMVGSWLLGLAWIATYYVTASTNTNVPVLTALGNWNLLIGFGMIIVGVVLSTKWR